MFGITAGDVIDDFAWGACNYKGNAGNTEMRQKRTFRINYRQSSCFRSLLMLLSL